MPTLRWTLAFSCLLAAASGFGISLQQRRPLLPAQRRPYAPVSVVRMQAEPAAVPDEPPAPVGLKARVAAMLPPKKEMQKLVRRTARLTIHRVSPSDRAAHSTPTTTRNRGRSLWPRCSSASCSRTRFCATPRTCWCAPPPALRQPSSAPVTRRPAGLWTSPPRAITTAQPAYPALTAYPALQALLA